jgi:hypothetical protein
MRSMFSPMRQMRQASVAVRSASSLISGFERTVNDLPMREAMRYTEKNLKWSAAEFKQFVDSQANGLIDVGFMKGETIAVWMKDGAEKDVTFMAAAKAGLKLIEAPSEMTVPQLRQFLALAPFKAIYFTPVTATQDCLLQLRKAIPEFFDYDDTHGQLFHSKYYPTLRYFIQTGFDQECGCLNYKRMFLPNPFESLVETVAEGTTDKDALYMKATIGTSSATPSPRMRTVSCHAVPCHVMPLLASVFY